LVELKENTFVHPGFRLHIVPSKKFKTVNIVVKCKAPLQRDTITKRALLPYLLEKGTKNYPSEKALMHRLDELYGATLHIDGTKKGEHHILTFRLEVPNEKFLPNETNITNEALHLLREVIFEPLVDHHAFLEKLVEREKVTLLNRIQAIHDDKMAFANMRLLDHMCKDEPYGVHVNGYEEDLHSITASGMYQYYQSMLDEDEMDLYLVGDVDMKEMKDTITNAFPTNGETTKRIVVEPKADAKLVEVNEVVEKQPIQQAKLHIGYRTNTTYGDDSDYFAIQVFNGLFGGFPSSKLFVNVREKESLAYYAASRIESHKGLLIVYSGIEGAEFEKTRDIIALQLKEMKAGNFTNEEVENIKELVISDIKETLDHSQGIVELLYQQVIAGEDLPPNEFIKGIQQVKKADMIRVAEKIELDTIYLLTSQEGS
jgi:predicted Zn-dependent peptidase